MVSGSGVAYRFINDRMIAIVGLEVASARTGVASAADPQSNNEQTNRGNKAMNHPKFKILSRLTAFSVGTMATALSFTAHAQGTT